jgi:hypothetical protein
MEWWRNGVMGDVKSEPARYHILDCGIRILDFISSQFSHFLMPKIQNRYFGHLNFG